MLRYMISPIIGTGVGEDVYRASVSDVANVNSAAIIPTHTSGPNLGQPKHNFALCLVATANVNAIAAVTNAYVFPDYNLDGRMDGMESEARTGLVQSVEAYNLDGNGLNFDASHQDGDSYRSLIQSLASQLDPGVNINGLNCAEVAG